MKKIILLIGIVCLFIFKSNAAVTISQFAIQSQYLNSGKLVPVTGATTPFTADVTLMKTGVEYNTVKITVVYIEGNTSLDLSTPLWWYEGNWAANGIFQQSISASLPANKTTGKVYLQIQVWHGDNQGATTNTITGYEIYKANPNPNPDPNPEVGGVVGIPPAFTPPAVGSVPLYEYVSGNKRRLTTVYYSSYPGFTYTGVFGYVFTSAEAGTVPLHRYTHPSNGNYYYTTTLTTTSGYNYGEIACYVYGNEVTNAYPVYENYSSSLGSFHRYSTSSDIFPNYSFGGVKFYILQHSNPDPNPIPNPVPIYVYHDGPATDHYFTSENRPAIGNGSFVNEGIAFYAFSKPGPGVVPIYVYYNQAGSDHYFTPDNKPTIGGGAFKNEGIVFYAYLTPGPNRIPVYVYNGIYGQDHYFTPDNQPTIGNGGYRNEGIAFYCAQ
ncbi:hypothetical protein FBD94_24490 [Pedobacter hiemivivus]|uniref:DUF5648 domain-containing protein n=1 Tax=Pedobacter hiemivivus TaxID=2530454 RepID=A0A4U1FXP6_9SPHI|nr:hypothetical protein [Pedobacter hiemivivus]TKC55807.1 hypothetical protein FBD94_24490 [Pedobacter hiemivivus]